MPDDIQRDQRLTASAFAARFGVTPRALRVYERAGLLRPVRTAAGWRVYGPREADALYQVLALKSLGLTLSQIDAAMRSADLGRVLAVQEQALEQALEANRKGLELVRAAKARVKAGASLSADDLVNLIKKTAMETNSTKDRYADLVRRHFPPELLDSLAEAATSTETARVQKRWIELMAEGERLKDCDPGSPEALDFGRRWQAQIAASVRSDREYSGYSGFFREGFADPELAETMPFSKALYDFIEAVRARLESAEGGSA